MMMCRCISALEELNELTLAPFMLKKQPDIVTTIRFVYYQTKEYFFILKLIFDAIPKN